ncbi:MAG: hypothetical protein JNM03_06880 [Sphingopyxis sp.]|uniref:hypothetical protein n=1 Tax=Sphingopyxis sp. TaxID=1908224 RepID=UPI001A59DB57|nr:hypothetical protein [Sphingopyxis sp.]MBL9069705.1 hypothetical protein [Sphingopyxis sp.]
MYAYVDRTVESLSNCGRFLLWAMRGWVRAAAAGTCPPAALHRGFAHVRATAALPDFHVAMALLASDSRETIALAPIDHTHIAEDEALLLSLWRTSARSDLDAVSATLALFVADETAQPVAKAFGAVAAALTAAGFDPQQLLAPDQIEESPTQ